MRIKRSMQPCCNGRSTPSVAHFADEYHINEDALRSVVKETGGGGRGGGRCGSRDPREAAGAAGVSN